VSPRAARPGSPAAVESFAESLAEWLSSFTVPQELAAEMADACAAGAPWAAALAGTSVRRAGWGEREALAWGIAIGALAGALEAARRSIAAENGKRAADGPALPLLAADGLIAAAHEALASLDPERLMIAMGALAGAFADGGPWRRVDRAWPRPAWPPLVACGLGPAAADDPDGPWAALAQAWDGEGVGEARWSHPAADAETRALFAEAAGVAGAGTAEGSDEQGF
jgi:hypothetical protein